MATPNIAPAHQESWDNLSEKAVQQLRDVRRLRQRVGFVLRGTVGFLAIAAVSFAGMQVIGEKADSSKLFDLLKSVGGLFLTGGLLFPFVEMARSCNIKLQKVEKEALFGDVQSLLTALIELTCHKGKFEEVYDRARRLQKQPNA